MELICYRPGRVGFNVGDVIEIPDDVDQYDRLTFRPLRDNDSKRDPPTPSPSNAKELQAQLDAANAEHSDTANDDSANQPDTVSGNESDKAEIND